MSIDIIIDADLLGEETEGELTEWLIEDGDTVATGDVVAEIETGKAVVEISSPGAGSITRLVAEGATVSPNIVIARITHG